MIPKFYAGQPVSASALNQLGEEIRKNEIRQVVGGTFNRTSGGTIINLRGAGEGGGPSVSINQVFEGDVTIKGSLQVNTNAKVDALLNLTQPYHPFQVLPGWSQQGYNVRVNGNSFLTNIETGEQINIEGLGAVVGSLADGPSSPNQFALPQAGGMIWLTVECLENEILSAFIEFGMPGQTGSWPNFPAPVEFYDSESLFRKAKYTRIAIAKVHLKSEGDVSGMEFNLDALGLTAGQKLPPVDFTKIVIIRQILHTNLGIQFAVVQSAVVPLLVPYAGSATY